MKLYLKNIRKPAALILAFFLSAGLTACSIGRDQALSGAENFTAEPAVSLNGQPPTESMETDGAKTPAGSPPQSSSVEPSITGSYFKAGDFRYQLEIAHGDWENRDFLSLKFSKRDSEALDRSNARTVFSEFLLPSDVKTGSFPVENTIGNAVQGGQSQTASVTLNQDGTVTLSDGTDASGEYYSFRDHLLMPDAFKRPINSTDLIGLSKNDMQLIRNEFYAVYGRAFKNKDLKAYFENQPWYRESTEASQFKEDLLGGLLKRNILFLKTSEDAFDETQAASAKAAYESLEPAPYLDLLPESGEILVTFSSEPENAEDKGLYYIAEGTVSVPVTLTAEEYQRLNDGESIELTVDGITGETDILHKSSNPSYGEYVFGDEQNGHYVFADYHPDTGLFTLWHNSADTDFKRVYQGDLYILKGAMEEYFGYFDLPAAGRSSMAGSYRGIDFEEDSEDPAPYSGNILVRDSGGYIKALYFAGD